MGTIRLDDDVQAAIFAHAVKLEASIGHRISLSDALADLLGLTHAPDRQNATEQAAS